MLRCLFLVIWLPAFACGDGGGKNRGDNEEGDTRESHSDCDSDLLCHNDACDEIFDRNFDVIIVSGEASASADWDSFGGAPDPFVYFAINNDDCVTSSEFDTFFPSWNEGCSMVVASGGTFEVVMFDEDLSEHDTMLTYSASGNDELAELIREETVVLSNNAAELTIRFEPDF